MMKVRRTGKILLLWLKKVGKKKTKSTFPNKRPRTVKRQAVGKSRRRSPPRANQANNEKYNEVYDKGFNDGYAKGLEDGALNSR